MVRALSWGAEEVTEEQEDARRGGEGAEMIFTFGEIWKLSLRGFKHNPNTPFDPSRDCHTRAQFDLLLPLQTRFVFTRVHLLRTDPVRFLVRIGIKGRIQLIYQINKKNQAY